VGEFAASSEFAAASLTGVATASQYYSMVSGFFLNALLGYDPADPLWAASFNEMVWQTLLFVPPNGG